jgi:hypothetical protein
VTPDEADSIVDSFYRRVLGVAGARDGGKAMIDEGLEEMKRRAAHAASLEKTFVDCPDCKTPSFLKIFQDYKDDPRVRAATVGDDVNLAAMEKVMAQDGWQPLTEFAGMVKHCTAHEQ